MHASVAESESGVERVEGFYRELESELESKKAFCRSRNIYA